MSSEDHFTPLPEACGTLFLLLLFSLQHFGNWPNLMLFDEVRNSIHLPGTVTASSWWGPKCTSPLGWQAHLLA
jgi:hypothetical protein